MSVAHSFRCTADVAKKLYAMFSVCTGTQAAHLLGGPQAPMTELLRSQISLNGKGSLNDIYRPVIPA